MAQVIVARRGPLVVFQRGPSGAAKILAGNDTANAARFAGNSASSATLSQEWAEGTEPGGPGTKSAKGWAEDASGFADNAEASADAAAITAANLALQWTVYETLDTTYETGTTLIIDSDLRITDVINATSSDGSQPAAFEIYETLDETFASGTTLIVDSDDRIIASVGSSVSNTEVITARGSRTSLDARISAGLTPYGDVIGPVVNGWATRESRARLRRLLDGSSTQLVIAVMGDSWVQGDYWTPAFAKRLQTIYGNAGSGWVGFAWWSLATTAPWAIGGAQPVGVDGNIRPDLIPVPQVSGSWVTNYRSPANHPTPSLSTISSSTPDDFVRFTLPAGHNEVELFYSGDGTGVVAVSWDDGGSYSTSISLAVTNGVGTVNLPSVPSTAATARIKVVSGNVSLGGVDQRSATAGVRLHKLGSSGSQGLTWTTASATAWQAQMGKLAANVFMFMSGTNDQAGSVAPATVSSRFDTMLTRFTAINPLADRIIATPPENNRTTNTVLMTDYAAAVRALAVDRGVTYVDHQYYWGSPANYGAEYSSATGRGWLEPQNPGNTGLIHPTTAGGYALADANLRLFERV